MNRTTHKELRLDWPEEANRADVYWRPHPSLHAIYQHVQRPPAPAVQNPGSWHGPADIPWQRYIGKVCLCWYDKQDALPCVLLDYDLKHGWKVRNGHRVATHADFCRPLDPSEIAPKETP